MQLFFDPTTWGTVGQWASVAATACAVFVAIRKNHKDDAAKAREETKQKAIADAAEKRRADEKAEAASKIATALLVAIRSELVEWERAVGTFGCEEGDADWEVALSTFDLMGQMVDETLLHPLGMVDRFPTQIVDLGYPLAPAIITAHSQCRTLADLLERYRAHGANIMKATDETTAGRRASAAAFAVRAAVGAIEGRGAQPV